MAIFIDSSIKRSLKAVLLQNGNIKSSIPIAHSVHLKECYESIEVLLEAFQYNAYKWSIWRSQSRWHLDGNAGRIHETLLFPVFVEQPTLHNKGTKIYTNCYLTNQSTLTAIHILNWLGLKLMRD